MLRPNIAEQTATTRATLAVWRGLIECQRSDIRCLILKAKMI